MRQGMDVVKEAIRAFPQLEHEKPGNNGVTGGACVTPGASEQSVARVRAERRRRRSSWRSNICLTSRSKKASARRSPESAKSPYFVQDAFHDALAGQVVSGTAKTRLMK